MTVTASIWTCPLHGGEVLSPYDAIQNADHNLRHGGSGRSWCTTCGEYVVAIEHTVIFEPTAPIEDVYH